MSKRSIVYIDGFNFYYGAIKGGPYRWLNLETFFRRLRQDDDLRCIKYFSARVDGPRLRNQEAYLSALSTCPLIRLILGKFKKKQVQCNVTTCQHAGPRFFESAEEKQTDVNIALQILNDAYSDNCDRFVLVTGDSDIVPAIRMLKNLRPEKQVIAYVPSRNPIRGAAVEIREAADKDKTLPLDLLKHCQFPATLPDGNGKIIAKPADW